jgi:hypothetical protein
MLGIQRRIVRLDSSCTDRSDILMLIYEWYIIIRVSEFSISNFNFIRLASQSPTLDKKIVFVNLRFTALYVPHSTESTS